VVAIRGNGGAFAALRKDGTVITWGYESFLFIFVLFLLLCVDSNA